MWWWIAAFVVSMVASYFLMPRPEVAKPPEVEEVDIPTVEDGKTIPVLFGTRDTESFNVVWWGDVNTRSFKVSGGDSTWYMDIEDVHGGYRYFVGIHAILFHGPIDNISHVWSDDKLAWSGEQADGIICDIGSIELYGDVDAEGGFGERSINWDDGDGDWPSDGCLEILMGYPDQERNWYLEHNLDGGDAVGDTGAHEVPAFRGVVSAVFNRFYIGNSPNLRKIKFRGQRIHLRQDGVAQWYDAKAKIDSLPCSDFEIDNMDHIAVYISTDMSNSIHRRGSLGSEVQNLVSGGLYGWTNQVCSVSVPDHFYGSTFDIYNDIDWSMDWPTSYNQAWYGVTDTADSCANIKAGNRNGTSTNYGSAASHMDAFLENAHEDAVVIHITITDGYIGFYDSQYYDDYYTAGSLQVLGDYLDNHERNIFSYAISYDTISAIEYVTENLNNIQNSSDTVPILSNSSACAQAMLDIIHDVAEKVTNPNLVKLGIPLDLNPAHIIRECITDPDWGMGGDELSPDEDAFVYAADYLYNEGMGISIKWTAQTSIDDFIDLIKRHINAELYPDHSTGKQILKLIRDDYDVNDLITLGEDDIVKVENAKRPLIGELVNSVTVQYWDACTGKDASVTVVDQALVQMQGSTINTTVQYPGFTNKPMAVRAATRDLRVLSTQLLSCTLHVKRTAETLNLGSVFIMQWPDLEIDDVVMRVQGIDFGTGRSNTIKLDVVEDIFSLPTTEVVGDDDDDPTWTNPSQDPVDTDYRLAFEMPYHAIVAARGKSAVDDKLTAADDAGWVGAAAVRTGNAINATFSTDAGSGYTDAGTLQFCATCLLTAAVDQIETAWAFDTAIDIGIVTVGMWAQIDDEIVVIDAIDTAAGTITVGRGVMDTSPRSHADDSRLFFWNGYRGLDNTEYADADSVDVKIMPTTGSGTLDIADATAATVLLDERADRPYPPADLQIDAVAYPTATILSNSIDVTWAQRNRLTQTALLDHTEASVTDEVGGTYTLYVIDSGDVTQITHAGETGTSKTIDMRGEAYGDYTLQVWAVRDSKTSWQCAEWDFSYASVGDGDGVLTAFTGSGVGAGVGAGTLTAFTGRGTGVSEGFYAATYD